MPIACPAVERFAGGEPALAEHGARGLARQGSRTTDAPRGIHRQTGRPQVRAGLAVALSIAAAVGVAAAPAAADPAPPTRLVWTTPDAALFDLYVPADAFAAFEQGRRTELDAERDRLRQVSAAMLAGRVGAALTELIARVPVYGDWLYGWLDSYITAFQVGARSFRDHDPATDETLGRRIVDAMRDAAAGRLAATVVDPAAPAQRLRETVAEIDAALVGEWQFVRARDRARWSELATAYASSARRVDDPPGQGPSACSVAAPVLSGSSAVGLDEATVIAALVESQQGLFGLRLSRPVALRAVAIAGRLAAGGLALAGGGIVGAGAAPTSTFALPWMMVGGLVWSLDYGVNRIDGLLHRDQLEARLVTELVAALDRRRADLASGATRAIDGAFQALTACRLPPPPPGTPVG